MLFVQPSPQNIKVVKEFRFCFANFLSTIREAGIDKIFSVEEL